MSTASGDNPGVKFPPPLFFVLGYLAGYLVHREHPLWLLPPGDWRWLGMVFLVTGVTLIADFVARFRRAATTIRPDQASTTLVTTGPFRFTRNPAYLGWVLIYVGASLLLNSLWPLAILPLVIISVQGHVIRREEQFLE